jgi:hypothetical protein
MQKHHQLLFIWITAIGTIINGCDLVDDSDDDSDDRDDASESCEDNTFGDLKAGTTWQWQLTGKIDYSVNVKVYDIDLLGSSKSVIDNLHSDGRFVICYFSAGTWEEWRDDAKDFPAEVLGNTMEEWDDEKWLDIRSDTVRLIMGSRMDIATSKGCDGVEPDNMDGYLSANNSGFNFNSADQLDYNRYIAEQAHQRGLSVGLKNDVDQLEELEPCYDWALNEECFEYNECYKYAPFIDSNKAVFHVEYVDNIDEGQDLADEVCESPSLHGFSTLIKDWDLSEWRISCG